MKREPGGNAPGFISFLFYMKPIIFLITGVTDVAVLDIVEVFPGATI
jgi:hypothetical protein